LSEKERDRLKVLHEVGQGHLTQRQAAGQLQMSERGFRKLLGRFRDRGDAGIAHGLRNRASRTQPGDQRPWASTETVCGNAPTTAVAVRTSRITQMPPR
jgi:hypothetical protein